jgi:exonuclease SbcC
LNGYAALDAELAAASHLRAANEKDYRTYIANEQSAATVATRQREAAEITAAVAEIERSFAEAQKEQSRLAAQYDRERQARTRLALDEARQRATQFATQLEHAREQHGRIEKQLAYLDEVRMRMREHLAAHDKYTRLSETADFIRDILQKAVPYLTESYVFSVSIEANQLYREITGRPDVTLRWTRDYEIVLEEEGRERPFGNLSGGEQMAAALAVRLALLKELSEVNLAFFDEPTTNMDEERRRNLAQQIGRIKDFQQLFVISHDDSFEGFTDQVITLGEKR